MFFSQVTQHYYSLPSTFTTYSDAFNQASKDAFAGVTGHLWVPNANDEFDRILNDIVFPVHRDPIWLALTDEGVEGKWLFTAGPERGVDVSDLAWWSGGEPNGGTGENCAVHWPGSVNLGDVSCFNHRLRFVIEYECPFGQRFNDQGSGCIGKSLKPSFPTATHLMLLADINFVCDSTFEGGGWLQVRYISASPERWHRAQDGMRGTDVYGYPGQSEYSIYFRNFMQPSSELLFVVGMQDCIGLLYLLSAPSLYHRHHH